MALSTDNLKFTIEVDSAKGQAAVKMLTDTVNKMNTSMGTSQTQMKALNSSFGQLSTSVIALNQAWELSTRVLGKIGSLVAGTVGKYAELETQVARIKTIISDTEATTTNFGEEILKLRSQFGGTVANIGGAFYEAIASGATDAAGAVTLVGDASRLAIGGVTDMGTALHALTGILMAYGMGVDQAGRVNDILFIGAREGKTSIQELAVEMGSVLAISKELGVSLEELTAMISTVSSSVGSTAGAVTSVRSALVALARQTGPMEALIKAKFGGQGVQELIKAKGAVQFLRDLKRESGGAAEAMVQLLERLEGMMALTTLTSGKLGGRFDTIMKYMNQSSQQVGDITSRAVGVMLNTVEKKADIFRANMEEIFIRIGNALKVLLAPAVETLAGSVLSLNQSFRELSQNFQSGAFDQIREAFVNLNSLIETLRPTLIILSGVIVAMSPLLQTLLVSLTSVSIGFALIAAKAIIVVAAFGAIEYFLQNTASWENFGNAILRVILKLQSLRLQLAYLADTAAASFLPESMSSSLKKSSEMTLDYLKNVEDKIAELDKKVKPGVVGSTLDAITKSFSAGRVEAEKMATATQDTLSEVEKLTNKLQTKTSMNAMISSFNELVNKAKQLADGMAEWGMKEEQIAVVRSQRNQEQLRLAIASLEASGQMTREMRTQAALAQQQFAAYTRFNILLQKTPETYKEAVKLANEFKTAAERTLYFKVNAFEKALEENKVLRNTVELEQLALDMKPESLKVDEERLALQQRMNNLVEEQRSIEEALAKVKMEVNKNAPDLSAVLSPEEVATQFQKIAETLAGGANAILPAIIEQMVGDAKLIKSFLSPFFAQTQQAMALDIAKMTSSFGDSLSKLWEGELGSAAKNMGTSIMSVFSYLGGIVKLGMMTLLSNLNLITAVIAYFNKDKEQFRAELSRLVGEFMLIAERFVENIPTFITSIMKYLPYLIMSIVEKSPEIIVNAFAAMIEGSMQAISSLGSILADGFFKGFLESLKVAFSNLGGTILRIFIPIIEFIVVGVSKLIDFINGGVTNYAGNAKRQMEIFKKQFAPDKKTTDTINKWSVTQAEMAKSAKESSSMDAARFASVGGAEFRVKTYEGEASKAQETALNLATELFQEESNTFTSGVEESSTSIFDTLTSGLESITDTIGNVPQALLQWGERIWSGFSAAAEAVGTWFFDKGAEIWGGFLSIAEPGIQAMIAALSTGTESMLASISTATGDMSAKISSGMGGLVDAALRLDIEGFIYAIGDTIAMWWGSLERMFFRIGDYFDKIFAGIKVWLFSLGDFIAAPFYKLGDWFTKKGYQIGDAIAKPFIQAGDWFQRNIVKPMQSIANAPGKAAKGVKGSVEKAGDWLAETFSFYQGGLIPALANGGIINPNVLRFPNGGSVPGFSPFPGDSPGNDRVLALLSPGEVVLPRTSVESLLGGARMPTGTTGGTIGGGTVQNVTVAINIEAGANVDSASLRRELIPKVVDELRKLSQNGTQVLSKRGVY